MFKVILVSHNIYKTIHEHVTNMYKIMHVAATYVQSHTPECHMYKIIHVCVT